MHANTLACRRLLPTALIWGVVPAPLYVWALLAYLV